MNCYGWEWSTQGTKTIWMPFCVTQIPATFPNLVCLALDMVVDDVRNASKR